MRDSSRIYRRISAQGGGGASIEIAWPDIGWRRPPTRRAGAPRSRPAAGRRRARARGRRAGRRPADARAPPGARAPGARARRAGARATASIGARVDDLPLGRGRQRVAPLPAHDHAASAAPARPIGSRMLPRDGARAADDLGQVALLAGRRLQRRAQRQPDVVAARGQDHAAGPVVEAVAEPSLAPIVAGAGALGKARDQRVGQRAALARVQRVRRHARGLVDGDQVRVGVQHRQR